MNRLNAILITSIFGIILIIYAIIPQDTVNKLNREVVSRISSNYTVTYATVGFVKSWNVKGDKVTSDIQKGYYFFWDENKKYVQVPINFTIIEETK